MSRLPSGWSKKDGKLLLVLKCDDFTHAVALLNSIADIAEKQNHHPDIGIRNYNEILVASSTHSEGKVTEKDYALAKEISDLLDYQSEKEAIESNARSVEN